MNTRGIFCVISVFCCLATLTNWGLFARMFTTRGREEVSISFHSENCRMVRGSVRVC